METYSSSDRSVNTWQLIGHHILEALNLELLASQEKLNS